MNETGPLAMPPVERTMSALGRSRGTEKPVPPAELGHDLEETPFPHAGVTAVQGFGAGDCARDSPEHPGRRFHDPARLVFDQITGVKDPEGVFRKVHDRRFPWLSLLSFSLFYRH